MKMNIIYKYVLISPVTELQLPENAVIRLVDMDPASGNPALWVEHELGLPTVNRTFRVFGTGHYIEPGAIHLGSMVAGSFVWHVYERPSETAKG